MMIKYTASLFLFAVLLALSEAGFDPANVPRPSIRSCPAECTSEQWKQTCYQDCTCRKNIRSNQFFCVHNESPLPSHIK
uniref:Putative secreted protein n=1 Tax=Amblyomma triste TaxID=251400 RepID=A0A023G111_AMBTT